MENVNKKHDRAKVGNTIQKREETNMVDCWHGCGYETKTDSPGLASVYTPQFLTTCAWNKVLALQQNHARLSKIGGMWSTVS